VGKLACPCDGVGQAMKSLLLGLIEDYVFDPGIVDLVLWFPHLDPRDFVVASLAVLGWNWLSERLWRTLRRTLIRWLAPVLGRYAFILRFVR